METRLIRSRVHPSCILIISILILLLSSQLASVSSKIFLFSEEDPSEDSVDDTVENTNEEESILQENELNPPELKFSPELGLYSTSHPHLSIPIDPKPSDSIYLDEDIQILEEVNDSGSWKRILDSDYSLSTESNSETPQLKLIEEYIEGMKCLFGTDNTVINLTLAIDHLSNSANGGYAHAQSVLAFLYSNGYGVEMDSVNSFLYHSFAAEGGSIQSKLALAYAYARQQDYEKAVELYAELALLSIVSNQVPGKSTMVEMVKLNTGLEESQEAMRGHRGEDDETLQYFEFMAKANDIHALQRMGTFVYYGARGLDRDHVRAFQYFKRASDLGDATSMCHLAEMYTFGVGTNPEPAEALRWFQKAQKVGLKSADPLQQSSALASYAGIGYLYLHGLGVSRNLSHALLYFKTAAQYNEPDALYYLGMMYLRGLGTRQNLGSAIKYLTSASRFGHLGSLYQLAKLHQKGKGMAKNLQEATFLYKIVSEKGPWGSLLRSAHTYYMRGQLYIALTLYSRAAELGYEVAQSNAAWLLERFGKDSGCFGPHGQTCTEEERNVRSHRLWKHASEQGNDQAALLVGDAYFFGKGTRKDLEVAAEAYRRASVHRSDSSAQASFNLGYMHEHGLGLPLDFHLAKRFYDLALEKDENAALPVKIALFVLWFRQNYPNNQVLNVVDMLPEAIPKVRKIIVDFVSDDGVATIITLFALLVAVLFLRKRQRNVMAARNNVQ